MNPSSYRLILLLPLISMIFEKILHGQMIDYLAQYNFLYNINSVSKQNIRLIRVFNT